MSTGDVGSVRIGELARRTGVSPELLRAWEQRYGLLDPSRSAGGFRLYSPADERRVRTMTALIRSGLSAAEAAARARAGGSDRVDVPALDEVAGSLRSALDRFDAEGGHAALDRLFGTASIETAISQVLVPYLHELGDRWEVGDVSVAQEHFASNLVRGRLLAFARDWAMGSGPAYVLACPPDEEHDLGLVMFGIAAARRGARIVFLGADTPVATMRDAVLETHPDGVVVAVARRESLDAASKELAALAGEVTVYVCGGGAVASEVMAIGGRSLEGGPVAAAQALV